MTKGSVVMQEPACQKASNWTRGQGDESYRKTCQEAKKEHAGKFIPGTTLLLHGILLFPLVSLDKNSLRFLGYPTLCRSY